MASFDSQPDMGQRHGDGEDWEDWLRWDPAAEPTSPCDTTVHSASSKNESPVQDHVFPATDLQFGKDLNSIFDIPLIAGDEHMEYGSATDVNNDAFLFGLHDDVSNTFDFPQPNTLPNAVSAQPRLNTDVASWSLPANTTTDSNMAFSATASEPREGMSATTPMTGTSPSYGHSPDSAARKTSSVSSSSPGPPKKRGGRKRKADIAKEADADGDDENMEDGDGPPVKKTSHNVIEKRYRNNLNDKIVELRNSVPSLRAMGRSNGGKDTEDLGGLTPAHKLNKATVMAKATEYILHLEKRNKNMADEMATLKARLAAVETALGRDGSTSANSSPGTSNSRKASTASQAGPSTFLNVPQDQTRFGQPMTPHQYRVQHAQPIYARPPNAPVQAQNQPRVIKGKGGIANKVMLGAMAGVMVMEGLGEQQQSGDGSSNRALAAFPVNLMRRTLGGGVSSPGSNALPHDALFPLLKTFLVVGVLVYLLVPLFKTSSPKHKKSRSTVQLPQAPSLASPVEVRRKAWLTAIQSVWVPKHFLLEVLAVGTKMIQLSVRRLIGSEAFTSITGTSKEEEAARIKAWDIAIDAQLAGGDAEVSYYRLLLTLMESGTLPDSPTRLMQKAVHFRVFFWDVANAGYGNIFGFKRFTEKVGRYYWDAARKIQKDVVQAKSQGFASDEDEIELLPDHLARLVELDCDEVLSDEMIQRAWNLAWNKPSAHALTANAARDSVVEDHAIRSPLDAVAAWYTNTTIDDTLADALNDSASSLDTEYYIGLALSVAPPASNTHVRALAAKAVLSGSNKDANIVAALDALPVMSPTGGMNLVNHAPASPDVATALTLAKLIALSAASSSPVSLDRAHHALSVLQIGPAQYTLLTAVAAYRLLRLLASVQDLPHSTKRGIEDIAAGLRVWMGTSAGRDCSISPQERKIVVDLCIKVAKRYGGWDERDSGYGSSSSSTPTAHSPDMERGQVVLT